MGGKQPDVQAQLNEIAGAITQIQNPRYREFAESFHDKMSKVITDASQSLVQVGSNSAVNIMTEYNRAVVAMSKDAILDDPKDFYTKNAVLSNSFKSSLLKTNLSQAAREAMDALTEENFKKMKESREESINVRHSYSVKCLTFVAYACYLNTISALVPGVDYRVPGSILFLAVSSVAGAQLTAPYDSWQEAWNHVRDISDRVMSNSGLRKCCHVAYQLTEKIAVTLNDQLEPYLGGGANPRRP